MHFHHQVLPQGWQQLQVKEVITSGDQVILLVSQAHIPRLLRIPEGIQEIQDPLMDQVHQEAEAMVHLTDQDPQGAYQDSHSRVDLQEEEAQGLQVATHRVSPDQGDPSP